VDYFLAMTPNAGKWAMGKFSKAIVRMRPAGSKQLFFEVNARQKAD